MFRYAGQASGGPLMSNVRHLKAAMDLPSVFYKYTPSSTALLVLETSRLRWSSPLIFNDVAEFRRMPRFDPTVAEAHGLLPEVIARAIFDNVPLEEERLGAPMKTLLRMVKALAASGVKREEILELMKTEASDADDRIESGLREHFEAQDIRKARVLCVTTEHDNDAMWGNYADSHAGCVLGFRHIEALSTPLLEAAPLKYSQDRPTVGSGLDFLLYGDTPELRERTLNAVCFTKKLAWAYEREWRALTWRPNEHDRQHGDYLFHPEELESVTLGARASNSTQSQATQLLRLKYPSACVYRMEVNNGELKRCLLPITSGDA
jgi:hypothetical protein